MYSLAVETFHRKKLILKMDSLPENVCVVLNLGLVTELFWIIVHDNIVLRKAKAH